MAVSKAIFSAATNQEDLEQAVLIQLKVIVVKTRVRTH